MQSSGQQPAEEIGHENGEVENEEESYCRCYTSKNFVSCVAYGPKYRLFLYTIKKEITVLSSLSITPCRDRQGLAHNRSGLGFGGH